MVKLKTGVRAAENSVSHDYSEIILNADLVLKNLIIIIHIHYIISGFFDEQKTSIYLK